MAIRIEWVLIISIVLTLLLSFGLKFDNQMQKITAKNELAFKDTIFSEVDTKGLLSFANVKSGEQANGVLTLNDVSFEKINDTKVTTKKAIYQKNEIVLIGDVHIKRNDGFSFYTQKAIYDPKNNIITSPGAYSATLNSGNVITGNNFNYNTKNISATSGRVHAIFNTKDK